MLVFVSLPQLGKSEAVYGERRTTILTNGENIIVFHTAPPGTGVLPATLLIGLGLFCLPLAGLSQPEVSASQLFFDARPIPTGPAPDSGQHTATAESSAADESDRDLTLSINEYLTSISELETDLGPYSNELMEASQSVGLLYQQQGEHGKAIDFLHQAQSISRINNGLNSLQQVPIIEALTDSYMALGELGHADEMQESLVSIHKALYGERSVKVVHSLLELGDWNLNAFFARRNIVSDISRPDSRDIAFFVDPTSSRGYYVPTEINPEKTSVYKVYEAQNNFLDALNILRQNRAYSHPDVEEIEKKIAATYFIRTHQEDIIYDPDFYLTRRRSETGSRLDRSSINLINSKDYQYGRESLERIINNHVRYNGDNATELTADALVNLADWDLLYKHKSRALKQYQEAYAYMAENDNDKEQLTRLLMPAIPVVLPEFIAAPHSRERFGVPADADVDYVGYMDVSYVISKYGAAKKVKVLNKSGTVTKAMQIRLLRYVRSMQFRPRFDAGKVISTPIALRYYFGNPRALKQG
ncbi:MAG: hypothetical protein RQ899_11360 [Pseudomonadales bacterium]|nr:hypothetical protein [Pseudomonadales bacterium]